MNDDNSINKLIKSVPRSSAETRKVIEIKGDSLIMCDIHIPYHSQSAIQTVLSYTTKYKIKNIILLGDVIDMFTISKFQKNPKYPNLQFELEQTFKVLQIIRKVFPRARIIYCSGNHDARLEKYLWTHSEMLELKVLKFENLLRLPELNIEFYDNYTLIKQGDLTMQHGDTIGGGGITPSRGTLLKNMTSILFGHLHRTDTYIFNPLNKTQIQSHSVGCLCNLNPSYWCYSNNWNHGFALTKEIKGRVIVENKRIIGKEII